MCQQIFDVINFVGIIKYSIYILYTLGSFTFMTLYL